MRTLAALVLAALRYGCGEEKTAEKKAATPHAPVKQRGLYKVKFNATKGDFTIEVHRDWGPQGADHLFDFLPTRFYDRVRFDCVARGFVCQFGINGNPQTQEIWGYTGIPDDPVEQKNRRGATSYGKLGPRGGGPDPAQIELRGNAFLDRTYPRLDSIPRAAVLP